MRLARAATRCTITQTVMPYKFETEKIKLPREKDRRVKLTATQRQEIRDNLDGLSNRALAAKYGVSKRLIQFIRHPERQAKNLLDRQARGGSMQYYDKDEWRETMREHRRYKAAVLLHK